MAIVVMAITLSERFSAQEVQTRRNLSVGYGLFQLMQGGPYAMLRECDFCTPQHRCAVEKIEIMWNQLDCNAFPQQNTASPSFTLSSLSHSLNIQSEANAHGSRRARSWLVV